MSDEKKKIKQWQRPEWLDRWGPPPFQNEKYLFHESLHKKHFDALIWAGNQIGFLMQAALDVFKEYDIPVEEAQERIRTKLRDAREAEAKELIEELNIPEDERDARTIGHLIMQWEAALGVSGEIMINTPTRFLRRFYGGEPWDRHLTPLILDIMGAEGEGFAKGVNPNLTFRTNRYSCGGDAFDEWVVEPVDEESVGREKIEGLR